MKTVCEKCTKEFNISVLTEELEDGVEHVYFICPKCKHQYTAYYTNEDIREKQNEIREMIKQYNKLKRRDSKKALNMLKEIKKLKVNIGKDMDILRKRIKASTK